jgi:hypothetical protein
MTRILTFLLLSAPLHPLSQVGIGTATPHASAKLEVSATNQGFLPPRVSLTSTTDASTIASPAAGLLVDNLATSGRSPFNVTSDARLKRDVAPIDDALQTVLRLQPHRYEKRRSMGQDSDVRAEYGFLAQDLQSLLPELVSQAKDSGGTLSVNYTALIPILARAVQEQQETIGRLETPIDELQTRTSESGRKPVRRGRDRRR